MLSKMRHLRLGGLSLRLPASPSLRALSSSPLQQDPLHSQDSGSDSAPRLGSVTPEEAQSYRKEHDVRIKGFSGDMDSLAPFTSFDTLPFSPALVQSLRKQGFSAPTAIQAQSWPIALLKRDMISIARTGSGKTCAFLLPALQALSQTPVAPPSSGDERDRARRRKPRRVPRTLVLAPTRELAQQIEREAAKYTSSVGVTVASFYGGTPKGPQMRQLSRGVDVVVATPGRCNDLVETGMLDLSSVDYLVLDEADRMLDMGFEPQIRSILQCCKTTKQSLFFTATWPKGVQALAMEYLNDPVTVNIGDQNKLQANKAITQHIHMLKPMEKYEKLEELLESLTIEAAEKVRAVRDGGTGVVTAIDDTTAVAPPIPFNPKNVPKTLVFVGKKAECDDIAYDIRDAGYPVGTLHGDKTQDARSFIMQQFRHNSIKVLVATDVAARGLDITDIECVINFDFPPGKSAGIEDYVHRIGRTARGNRTGVAHSFFTPSDSHMAKDLVGILERSGQDVPEELRKMGNPRRMNSRGGGKGRSSGGNYGKAGGGGGKFGDNYDMIGGTRGKRDGGGERSFNPRSSGGASSYKGSGGYKGNGGGFRSGGRGDESGESDSFYRSGGFKVGNKKFGGGGGGQKSGSNNRGGGGAKKPKYKSIYDDDEYF